MSLNSRRSPENDSLTWALCVSTLNRPDPLEECIRCALRQTRLPGEIVVVDASENWQENQRTVEGILRSDLGNRSIEITLTYLPADRKSLTAQRNQGISHAIADICFLFDDDAFMHVNCAEIIMKAYEEDPYHEIAAVSAAHFPAPPFAIEKRGISGIERKSTSLHMGWESILPQKIRKFVYDELLIIGLHKHIVKYDHASLRRQVRPIEDFTKSNISCIPAMNGFSMTVRRSVALAEPFEAALIGYSAGEDLDASYRFGRHGHIVQAHDAHVYHHEAQASRLKRRQATELAIANCAFFIRRHSSSRLRHSIEYSVLVVRRIIAEFVKDSVGRRFDYPQFRGAVSGFLRIPAILSHPNNDLDSWYVAVQERILAK